MTTENDQLKQGDVTFAIIRAFYDKSARIRG
jgi:hypothetical protein